MNRKTKNIFDRYVGPAICVMGGILFAALGIAKLVKTNSYKPTSATVVRIEENIASVDENGISEYTYTAFAQYEVDGRIYEEQIDDFGGGYEQGSEIKILYDPDDPSDITVPKKTSGYILIAFGALLFASGGISLYISFKRDAEER